jgi:hypothetical protein
MAVMMQVRDLHGVHAADHEQAEDEENDVLKAQLRRSVRGSRGRLN